MNRSDIGNTAILLVIVAGVLLIQHYAQLDYVGKGISNSMASPLSSGHMVHPRMLTAGSSDILHNPTSPQWRHPGLGLPKASITVSGENRESGELNRSFTTEIHEQHDLSVLSLITSDGAMVDPDSGLYTIGNAIINDDQGITHDYNRTQRWWRYPGNYHFRGKDWERHGTLQFFPSSRSTLMDGSWPVQWRINGNNTRGFPQKAIRIYFPETKKGRKRAVLRCAGNDYDRMFMRDPLQHRLCASMPFDVMDAEPIVLYINGVYWGLHYIRPRMDEVEISNRYGLREKDVTILEDMAEHYRGNGGEVRRFWSMVDSLESLQDSPKALYSYASEKIDLAGFFSYMSAQMIFGNKDWPFQNLKYWKYTGPAVASDTTVKDGRWRFIMGDSDLAFGYEGVQAIDYDMFKHVMANRGVIARLFASLMHSDRMKSMFADTMRAQLHGALRGTEMLAGIDELVGLIQSEMDDHTNRWKRPLNEDSWLKAVEEGRFFAAKRGERVLVHLDEFLRQDDSPN